jgi:uncharacterized protein YabE (DUF348 family)
MTIASTIILLSGFLVLLIIFLSNNNQGQVLGATIVSRPVEIIDNGIITDYMSPGNSASEIFQDLKIQVFPEDKVTVFIDPAFGIGTRIKIRRATAINVNDGGTAETFHTWQDTVSQLLKEKNITLSTIDKINPPIDTTLLNNMNIIIIRVRTEQTQESVAIPFQTTNQNDPSQYVGNSKIQKAGVNGEKNVTYTLTYENNILTFKVSIAETIITQPVTQIVLKGTRKKVTVSCGGYNSTVEDAAAKNGIDPNALCITMMKESNGHANSSNPSGYYGLFQYTTTFWAQASSLAGYSGASIWDANSQIYVTAWAWAHGFRGRWP